MKILHLNDHYARVGGAETILFNTLSALEERGVNNVVAYQHPSEEPSSQRRAYRIPELGEIRPSSASRVADSLGEIVRTEQPDLIHLHDIGSPDVLEISRRSAPTVQNVLNHSFYCPGGMKYLPRLRRICGRSFGLGCLASAFLTHCNSVQPKILLSSYERSRRMLRQTPAPLFIAQSRYQEDQLVESGYPKERVRTLLPFTGLPVLSEESAPPPSSEPILLFSGRVYFWKGLPLLLRSLRKIRSSFRLVVAGEGPGLAAARRLAVQLRLSGRVEFLGWVSPPQQADLYRRCAVAAIPFIWPEPFGMVGIEAMSYEKPVVAFRVGGIPEWLEDGRSGFLVKPQDIREFAEKLDLLLGDPEAQRRMGREGRKIVETRFSKEAYVPQLLRIYEEALHDR